MRALSGRVRRLEGHARPGGRCPGCGGHPPVRVVLPGEPDPQGCPRCGREPLEVRIAPRPVVRDAA